MSRDFVKTFTAEPTPANEAERTITGTQIGDKRALDTYIQGGNVAASSSGAANGKTSTITIDETGWFELINIPPGLRKGLGIQNYSGEPILISLTNSLPADEGTTMEHKGERFYDIQAPVYARRKSGVGSLKVTIEELY